MAYAANSRESVRKETLHSRVPVTFLDGSKATLSPGGQNVLLRAMVEQFCPRFTPGGRVLYLGDAEKKHRTLDIEALAALGVELLPHGKIPDLIVYLPERNWLVLMEAASSVGPVDAKRHDELRAIFATSSAGLIFVSCFPTKVEMRRHFDRIAWETDAWCADHPDHLVHFNGERFLGPY